MPEKAHIDRAREALDKAHEHLDVSQEWSKEEGLFDKQHQHAWTVTEAQMATAAALIAVHETLTEIRDLLAERLGK